MRIPTLGVCIYCRRSDKPLTDEHIIPFSIQGELVFCDASCRSCADLINRFEQPFARYIFGNFRNKYGLNTRRKKNRSATLPLEIMRPDGTAHVIEISVHDHPAPVLMYKYLTASILLGSPKHVDTKGWQPLTLADEAELKRINERFKGRARFTFKLVPEIFAKELAKIAYSFAVAELGLNAFRPLVLDLIIGDENNFCYTVGSYEKHRSGTPGPDHRLAIFYHQQFSRTFLVVNIRLFGNTSSTDYHVVVGDLVEPEHFVLFQKHKLDAEAVDFSLSDRDFVPTP